MQVKKVRKNCVIEAVVKMQDFETFITNQIFVLKLNFLFVSIVLLKEESGLTKMYNCLLFLLIFTNNWTEIPQLSKSWLIIFRKTTILIYF